MAFARKMAYWSTTTRLSRLIPWKAVQLHVLQTLPASLLRSYPVKARAIHPSTRSRTRHSRVRKITISTTTTGVVIRVRHHNEAWMLSGASALAITPRTGHAVKIKGWRAGASNLFVLIAIWGR